MKPSYIYNVKAMLGALVLAGIMAGCADNEIVEITPADDSSQRQEPYVPESDDISRALAAIEGISDVTVDRETYGNRKAYYFFVEMPVSHREETGQTFRLRCALEYEGAEAPVVFYTSGYDVGNNTNQLDPNEMKGFLKANMLHMEHRYFGESQPQSLDDISYKYLWTTLLKEKFFTGDNQWVSTGLSKGGITSALYAYYSDLHGWDDMDLYVPFGAPFFTGTPTSSEDMALGTYTVNVCGSGYDEGSDEDKAFKNLRKFPNHIANGKPLRDACLRKLWQKSPALYLAVLKAYPDNIEQAATAVVLSEFYENLSNKFSYVPYSKWAKLVPDPGIATRPEAWKAFNDQRMYNEAVNGKKVVKLDNPVFTLPRGGIIRPDRVNSDIKRICEKTGIEYFTCHAFRATFASRCIAAGMPVKSLMEILGHTDVQMTLGLYGHAEDGQKREQILAVNM